jgi:hypothetical protein
LLRVVSAMALALATAVPLLAQDSRGRVQGTILDQSGAVVSGASVTLQNDATGVAGTRHSGETGRYVFDQVDPGMYTVTVKQPGFSTVIQKNVRVGQTGDVTADIHVKVSALDEVITVTDSPVAVQFTTANREMSLEPALIRELPMIGRNPVTLTFLDPSVGMMEAARTATFDHYAANVYDLGGHTTGQNEVLIDGSPLSNSSKMAYNPPVEAVGEYTVRQNAVDAEYGHSAGGIISMSMRSGTNAIHGTLSYYGQNADWNAMTDRINRAHAKAPYWNAGGSIGGPIVKNKLFLYSVYEKSSDTSFRNLLYTVPTALERQGDFSQSYNKDGSLRVVYDPLTTRLVGGKWVRDAFPGNRIPQDRWDRTATHMLDNLWMPNNPGDDKTGLNNYKYNDERYYRYYNLTNRVDWQINSGWKASARVSFFRTNQPANDYTNGVDVLKMRRTEGSQRNGFNAVVDTVYTINKTTTLTARGSYGKTTDQRIYPQMDIGEAGYHDLWPNDWWKANAQDRPILYFPNIQVPSGDTFGVRNFWYQQPSLYAAAAKIDKFYTRHALKVGTEARWKRGWASRYQSPANFVFRFNETANTPVSPSSSTGAPWASFLLGVMDTGVNSTTGAPNSWSQYAPLQYTNDEMYALFVQDDWTVNRRLTINLGLRYEYEGGYWDPENMLPQRLDLTDPIPGMQAAIAPKLASTVAGATGKTVAQVMSESAGQKSYLYNGAFYFVSDASKRATASYKYGFMPRVGIAYRLDDKMAVRLGYGRFYTPNTAANNGNEPLGSYNMAAYSPITPVLPDVDNRPQAFLSNPFPQGTVPAYGNSRGRYTNLGDAISIPEYERLPAVSDRISLSVQREVWGKVVVDVSYLANFVKQDLQTVNLNLADPRLGRTYKAALGTSVDNPFYNYQTVETFPGALRTQPKVTVGQLLRPYPQYGDISQTQTDVGKFRQRTFQIRLQRPFQNGFSFMLSYAYVRAKSQLFYDNDDQYDWIWSNGNPQYLTWVDTQDPKHRLTGAITFQLPFGRGRAFGRAISKGLDLFVGGWQISASGVIRSGQALRFGAMTAPASVKQVGGVGKNGYWFDTTGFASLPSYTRRANPYQYDNLFGPPYRVVDAVLSKRFTVHKDVKLQVRLEAYNVLNMINWANPNLTVTASDFGVTNALYSGTAGRQLQYAFRLEF